MSLQERTLVVRNFDHTKLTPKLLKELCIQGGPVKKVIMRENHAFVEYEDVESVSYSKALLNGVEIFGEKLQLEPKVRSQTHLKYHDLLIDYINHDKRARLMQQPQPVVWQSQQQPQPSMWDNFQQQLNQQQLTIQQQQQQLLLEQQQQQHQAQVQLQQARPAGQFDVYGQFFMQSQQPAPVGPYEYIPPSNDMAPFQQPNYFVPNQMPQNDRGSRYSGHHRNHHSNNLGRSRSFNNHQQHLPGGQSNNRRQSAQDFKNRRR